MFWLSFPKRGSDVGWAPCPCKSQYQLLQPRLWKGPVVLQPRAPAAPPSHVGPLPRVTPAQVWNPAPSSVSTKPLSPMGAVECMEWGRAGVGQGLHGPRTQSFPFPLEEPGLPPCPRKGLLSPMPAGSPSLLHAEPVLTVAPDPSPVPLPAQGHRSTGLSRSHHRTPPSCNLHKQKRSSGELPEDCGVQGRLWSLGPSHLSSARWRGSFCKHRGISHSQRGRTPRLSTGPGVTGIISF